MYFATLMVAGESQIGKISVCGRFGMRVSLF